MSIPPLEYCLECFSKHLGRASEYFSEAVDFYQRDNVLTERVQKKIRAASDTLGAMEDDLTDKAPMQVRAIYDQAQEIRKNLWSKGLDVGLGEVQDILTLKRDVGSLQETLYGVKKELTGMDWLVEALFQPEKQDKLTKALNSKDTYVINRDQRMLSSKQKEVIGINGAQFIAKGLERIFVAVDTYMGRSTLKPHLRASTWLNVAIGMGVQLGALYTRMSSPNDIIMVSEGAHHLTKIVDYVEEYVPVPVTVGAAARARAAAQQRIVYQQQQQPYTVRVDSTRTVEALPTGTAPQSRYSI